MIASFARLLVRMQCYNLSGSFLTLASKIIGGGCRITYNKNGYWRHAKGDWIVNEAFPNIRMDMDGIRKFNNEVYFRRYQPRANDVCIDVGAGIGTECISMSRAVGPQGKVFAIEASPFVYNMLTSNVLDNQLENVHTYNLAIADKQGKMRISDVSEDHISNSLWGGEGAEIDTLTMDQFVEMTNIERIDFLKVNIEGAEKLLIRQFDRITAVRNVAISCHDFLGKRTGDPNFFTRDQVTAFLVNQGFSIESANTGVDYIDDWIYGVSAKN